MITFPMAQRNMQMYSGQGPKLIYYVTVSLPTSSYYFTHREKYQIYSPVIWCVLCERNTHSKLSSQIQERETERQMLCGICSMDSFTKQTLLLACLDKRCIDLVYTPDWARKSHVFQGSCTQGTLLSNLVCVPAKLAESREPVSRASF